MNKPKIRFEGYTEAWEQRKLSEIADKVSEKNKNNEYNEPLTNSAEQGIISQKDYFDREVVNEDNLDGYYIVRDNDFVYNPRVSVSAPVGPINRNRLGRNGVMSPLYTVFRTHDIDTMYLEYYYKTTKWHRFMKLNGDSGARFDRFTISSTLFMEMPIPYPSIEEQEKIGVYFDNLDSLITLHQRKCEQTKKLKKYMLQKMFPQNGELYPEIRFEGFTEAWEQRKLSDYLEVSKEKNKEETFGKEDVLSVSGEFGIVNQIEFQGRSFAGASVANYGVVEVGDVVYTKSPLKSNPYGIIKTNQGKSGIVSTLYAVYKARNNVNPEFVQIYFELDSRMNSYMHPLVNKGAKNDMKVSDENALKGPVIFPEIEEQKLISQYFARLDRLITLHQHKCEELQNMKKYMLQNMFAQ